MNFSYPKDFPPDLYLTQTTTLDRNQPCDLLLIPHNQIITAHALQCSKLYATYNNIRGYGKHRTIIQSVFPTWTLLAHKDKDINSFIVGHRLSQHTAIMHRTTDYPQCCLRDLLYLVEICNCTLGSCYISVFLAVWDPDWSIITLNHYSAWVMLSVS